MQFFAIYFISCDFLAYAFFAYFWPKNRRNEINSPKITLAKYKNQINEINRPKNA